MRRTNQLFLLLILFAAAWGVQAQQLWKYVDKDGKVTYSDKPPKKGEKAEEVKSDPKANILETQRGGAVGKESAASQALKDVNARANARADKRDKLRDAVDNAKDELEAAKKALEDGREPLPDEVQIVVGRTKDGAPTGRNAGVRKPEYYKRIEGLEAAVKKAETALEVAEGNYRRGAP
ncbi:MAG: DUF4124 domain-containing protein [Betaproteobacteria bacterium]|nr:DUF4124 domain-containing protein [Betaproteobacteria bacterium]